MDGQQVPVVVIILGPCGRLLLAAGVIMKTTGHSKESVKSRNATPELVAIMRRRNLFDAVPISKLRPANASSWSDKPKMVCLWPLRQPLVDAAGLGAQGGLKVAQVAAALLRGPKTSAPRPV